MPEKLTSVEVAEYLMGLGAALKTAEGKWWLPRNLHRAETPEVAKRFANLAAGWQLVAARELVALDQRLNDTRTDDRALPWRMMSAKSKASWLKRWGCKSQVVKALVENNTTQEVS